MGRGFESPMWLMIRRTLILICFFFQFILSWAQNPDIKNDKNWDFEIVPITHNSTIFKRIEGKSYAKGCNFPLEQLRYLKLLHYNAKGEVCRGEMICNKAISKDLIEIFQELFKMKYPIESMRLIDDFDADDEKSMRANNTSAFIYRKVAGTKVLSYHSRGLAVDINPLYNPYIKGNLIQPANAKAYTNRSGNFPYKITTQDPCYKLFKKHGFTWGGSWRSLKDYQHFEKKL